MLKHAQHEQGRRAAVRLAQAAGDCHHHRHPRQRQQHHRAAQAQIAGGHQRFGQQRYAPHGGEQHHQFRQRLAHVGAGQRPAEPLQRPPGQRPGQQREQQHHRAGAEPAGERQKPAGRVRNHQRDQVYSGDRRPDQTDYRQQQPGRDRTSGAAQTNRRDQQHRRADFECQIAEHGPWRIAVGAPPHQRETDDEPKRQRTQHPPSRPAPQQAQAGNDRPQLHPAQQRQAIERKRHVLHHDMQLQRGAGKRNQSRQCRQYQRQAQAGATVGGGRHQRRLG